jgi:cell wall assembly regulator SMI1
MQQFTRSLTREIEVGGERLAITLSKEGLSVRPVGGRRPPHTMSWQACLHSCVTGVGREPSAEEIQQALEAIKKGGPKSADTGTAPEKTPASEQSSPASDQASAALHTPANSAATPASPASEQSSSASHTSAPAASAAMGDKIPVLLARLDQWINHHRHRFQKALRPGASTAECDELSAALGKPLPAELRSLLTWHNGQNADVPSSFEQSWSLMSSQDIAEAKKELDAQPHEGWNKDWVPFLEDESGDYRCLDLSKAGCPVLDCWRGRADHPVVAPSLSAWLADFVHGLENNAYAEDAERGTLARRS